MKVGEATAPLTNLIGEALPAKFPAVREALSAGRIGAAAASMLVTFLDRMIIRLEAHLDPDGVAPREDELRAQASLSMFERDGMLHLNAVLDPARGAAVKTAIEGFVSAEFAARRDRGPELADVDRRTVAQIQADALVHFAEHALTCQRNKTLNGAAAIVRMDATDLANGTGGGLIDGIDQPVSIDTGSPPRLGGRARTERVA